jgi:hypothetical protein
LVLAWTILPSRTAGAQDVMYPDIITSDPTDAEANVGRERGRKGLVFQFKYRQGTNLNSNAGFPLTIPVSAAVTLTINGTAQTCSSGLAPSANACSYVTDDGVDGDGVIDAVRILYNGDFLPTATVNYSVTGARDVFGQVQDPATAAVVTFTASASAPRIAASIELVFDISGSMGWPATPGGSVTRMDALKGAVGAFFGLLNTHAMLGDKIGVTYFSSSSSVFDPSPGGTNLEPAHDPSRTGLIAASIQSQFPTTATSIGAGLLTANTSGFAVDPTPNPRKFVVLFSDGQQNTPPCVDNPNSFPCSGVLMGATGIRVGGVNYPADIRVCPVTAGRQAAPGFTLQQNIAHISCNDYNAHVADASTDFVQADLRTYFAQALLDVLQGDKLEMVRDIRGVLTRGATVQEKFLGNANDQALTILLSSSQDSTPLPMQLTAPNGVVVDISHRTQFNRGTRVTSIHFPLRQGAAIIDPKGEWRVDVAGAGIKVPQAAYQLQVVLDNSTIATDFRVVGQDFGTGEAIPIQVRITDGGAPVLGAAVAAQIEGPNMGVGDILSTTPAPDGTPSPSGDAFSSPADAKLLQLLAAAYAHLFGNSLLPVLPLVDDGQGAHGDATAGDGVYSGLFYGAREEGHYFFTVEVRGSSAANGPFQRTRRLVTFVRPKAAASSTTLAAVSSVTQPNGTVIVRLQATPRDAFRNYVGPGYLHNLTITSSQGTVAAPLEDKLNGSYEISFQLPSASANPLITLEVMGRRVMAESLSALKFQLPKQVFSLHAGTTVPAGTLSSTYNGSVSLAADFEYRLTPRWSVEAYGGYDRFKSRAAGPDFSVSHVSVDAKATFGVGRFRPAVQIGPGVYFAQGGNTYFGWNGGASMQYWVRPKFATEASYNYHNANGGKLRYSTLLVGVRVAF